MLAAFQFKCLSFTIFYEYINLNTSIEKILSQEWIISAAEFSECCYWYKKEAIISAYVAPIGQWETGKKLYSQSLKRKNCLEEWGLTWQDKIKMNSVWLNFEVKDWTYLFKDAVFSSYEHIKELPAFLTGFQLFLNRWMCVLSQGGRLVS